MAIILSAIGLISGIWALIRYNTNYEISDLIWGVTFLIFSNIWALSANETGHYNKIMQEIKQGACISED